MCVWIAGGAWVQTFGGSVAPAVAVAAVLADDHLLRSQSSSSHRQAVPAPPQLAPPPSHAEMKGKCGGLIVHSKYDGTRIEEKPLTAHLCSCCSC
jgi:hypothetical protein